jgi:methyltransferase family protein
MKKFLNSSVFRRSSDMILSPLTLFSALWFKFIRSTNVHKMPVSERIFMKVGVLPINDHYYQPLINPGKHLSTSLSNPRQLLGINWNVAGQLELLDKFNFQFELEQLPNRKKDAKAFEYYYDNDSFCPGDAEYCYNVIRHFQPKKVIEIGCGYSTMLSVRAERKNASLDGTKTCEHVCIEPYEMPWLESLNIEVKRSKVEDVDISVFESLNKNDILFIDSSHIIRPQGDVLFEFLHILPILKSGVIVHVHDIFTPADYPKEWVIDKHSMWNEQYLLEAFLSFNDKFTIIGALNFLKNQHQDKFNRACPNSAKANDDQPGSFWFVRN